MPFTGNVIQNKSWVTRTNGNIVNPGISFFSSKQSGFSKSSNVDVSIQGLQITGLSSDGMTVYGSVSATQITGNGVLTPNVMTISNIQVTDATYVVQDDTAMSTETGGFVVINGTNFGTVMMVTVGNTQASAVSYVNSTRLHVTLPSKPSGSYTLTTTRSDGSDALVPFGITYSPFPVWGPTSILGPCTKTRGFTLNITPATSDSNITYSATSIPLGTTLTSNGILSGNITENSNSTTTYTFEVKATDQESQDTSKTFTLTGGFLKNFGDVANAVVVTDGTYATSTNHLAVSNTGTGFVKFLANAAVFQSGASIILGNTAVANTTFISSTEMRAQIPAATDGTISALEISNPDGSVLTNTTLARWAFPVWTTSSGQLGAAINKGTAFTRTVLATHGAGTVTYANVTSLPTGITLDSSTGIISGTFPIASSNEIVTLLLNAISTVTLQNASREFTLSFLGVVVSIYSASTILTTSTLQTTAESLSPSTSTLLFRASRDGYTASAFHSRCNGYAPLFIVIKANTGYIATAYTSVAYYSVNNYVSASSGSNWMNNLWNGSSTSTSKFYNNVYPQYSIYDNSSYGPTFGGGHDMYIPDNFNTSTGYTYPYAYSGFGQTTLFGSYSSWTVAEMEIYRV